MPLGPILKFGVSAISLLAGAAFAHADPLETNTNTSNNVVVVQYYPQPGYGPGRYEDRYYQPRMGPGNACQQRVGDYFRVPSKHVRQLDTRVVDRGIYQISMSVQGRIVYCTVDAGGNVLNIQ